jgi:hypothetical protein
MILKEYNSQSKSNLIKKIYCVASSRSLPPFYIFRIFLNDGSIFNLKDFKLDDFPNHTKKDTKALKMMKAYQNKLNMDYYQLHSDLDN